MKVLISRSIRTPPCPPIFCCEELQVYIFCFLGFFLVDKLIVCAKIDHMYTYYTIYQFFSVTNYHKTCAF